MTENQSERFKINEHLLDFIRKNCSERLSIKEIALKCGYTPEHFSRIYKKYTGVSPTEFILSCKIDRAKKLIATTDMPIEAVMLECGFSNRTAFFNSFSKNVGCTPLKYRKNQK